MSNKLTDTGERRAIAEEAAQTALARAADKEARFAHTPYPGQVPAPSDSSSRMFQIAETVVDRKEPEHMRNCENDPAGPVCKVTQRIGKLEERMEAMDKRIGERIDDVDEVLALDKGRRKQNASFVMVLTVLIGIGTVTAAWIGALRSDARASGLNNAIVEELRALKTELQHAKPNP
jgi:hypothetical protein